MSNIYNTEPAPSARVVMSTSAGDLDIELWAKETPLASRNFLQLAMEGYYDGTTFHRLVQGFIIQGGDASGAGDGGESIYGQPFADEPHQRLRLNRRGLLACANEGERDSNTSQFFFTLDATPELQGRHTMFGRITGPTIYNLLTLASHEVQQGTDTPVQPAPKVLTVKVLEEPWGDVKPRITREERAEQERARRVAKKERAREREKGAKGVKNKSLLSFGETEEEGAILKGPKSSHDLLPEYKRAKRMRQESEGLVSRIGSTTETSASRGDRSSHAQAAPSRAVKKDEQAMHKRPDGELEEAVSLAKLREQASKPTAREEQAQKIAKLEASLRRDGATSKEEEVSRATQAKSKGRLALEAMRAQYTSSTSGGGAASRKSKREMDRASKKERENEEALERFKDGLRRASASVSGSESPERSRKGSRARGVEEWDEEERLMKEYGSESSEGMTGGSWREHVFRAGKDQVNERVGQDDQYVTLDPRAPGALSLAVDGEKDRGKRGRELVESREDHSRRSERRGKEESRRQSRSSRRYSRSPQYGRARDDRGKGRDEERDARRVARYEGEEVKPRDVQRW